jgi:hypothetical protein
MRSLVVQEDGEACFGTQAGKRPRRDMRTDRRIACSLLGKAAHLDILMGKVDFG